MIVIMKNTIPDKTKENAQWIRQNITRALKLVMEVKRTECVKRCPKDIGTLRNTIHTTPAERNGNAVSVSIVAGGPAAPYAVVQHENLQYHHTEGQAKYIESVILESRATIASEINDLLKF